MTDAALLLHGHDLLSAVPLRRRRRCTSTGSSNALARARPPRDRRPLRRRVPAARRAEPRGEFPHRPERHGAPARRAAAAGSPLVDLPHRAPGAEGARAATRSSTAERSTSSTSTTSRWSAGRACSATATARASSTRRTSTGSSARCTCSGVQPRAVRAAALPALHARLPPAAAALALHAAARARAAAGRPLPLAEPLHDRRSTAPRLRAPDAAPAVLPARRRDRARAAGGGRRGERPYFLFVGRLGALKGVAELIEAFRDYRRGRSPDRRRRGRRGASCGGRRPDLAARALPRTVHPSRAAGALRRRASRWSSRRSATRCSASSRSRRSRSGRR